jgi:hypothetical protein
MTVLESGDSLLFVQEHAGLSLAEVASTVTGDDPALIELAGKLLTRRDIDFTMLKEEG